MNILIILAHPDKTSFNHAIARACSSTLSGNGHTVIIHDLCAENFDPVLPAGESARDAVLPPEVQRHCTDLMQADGIIIVHPNWWGQPPAILKGWVDRVIRPGVAYEFVEGDKGEGVPHGLLKAHCVVIFNTSNTATEREKCVFGDPLETIWKNCVFGLCGVPVFHRRMFSTVVMSSESERTGWLAEVTATVGRFFPKKVALST